MIDTVITVLVIVIVVGLVSRGGRPGDGPRRTGPPAPPGGSATWSSARTPADGGTGTAVASSTQSPGPRTDLGAGAGGPTPAPGDPIMDRIGDEQFIEGFVIGRHVTLAEQERLRERERAALEAELPGDDVWAHGGDDLGHDAGGFDAADADGFGGADADGFGGVDVGGFGGVGAGGFEGSGEGVEDDAGGWFDDGVFGDDTGFDGFDDDW